MCYVPSPWTLPLSLRSQNVELPYGSSVDGPNATIGDVELSDLPGSVASFRFEIDEHRRTPQTLHGKIIINDFLTPSSGFVGYCLKQKFHEAFLLKREAVEAAYKNSAWRSEYVSYSVPVGGCQQLTLVVVFPPSHQALTPVPIGVVFEAGREVLDEDESADRFREKVTYSGGTATLVIPEPKIGLRYAVSWKSPRTR